MEWLTEKWDRVILAVVALIAIAVGALFVKNSLAYPDRFQIDPVSPDGTIQQGETGRVESAINFVTADNTWNLPIRGTGQAKKALPLFTSIKIVEVGGKLIDMNDPDSTPVRPPASNKWLLDNGLDFLDANVMKQDPDGDGFINEEEWEVKTSPMDDNSHPSYAGKIHLLNWLAQNYTLVFSSKLDAERFQVTREKTANYGRDVFIMKIGEISEDGKFRIDSYEQKQGTNALGTTVDTSDLTVTYLESGEQHKLTRRIAQTIPTYYAEVQFELGTQAPWKKFVKAGDTFKLPIDLETTYKVFPRGNYRITSTRILTDGATAPAGETIEEVTEDDALISFSPEPGKENFVKIKQKS